MRGREVGLRVIGRWRPEGSIRVGAEVVKVLGACISHEVARRRAPVCREEEDGRKCMFLGEVGELCRGSWRRW